MDPADLRRHKELIDRSYYGGPVWENRKRNPSLLEEENPQYNYVEDPGEPYEYDPNKDNAFDVVKR